MHSDSGVLKELAAHEVQRTVRPRIPASAQPNDANQESYTTGSSTVLSDFIESSQLWNRERAQLPRRLRWALWTLVPLEFFWVIWLVTIITGATSCGGLICTVVTLDHHAAALLACGVFCVADLVGLIPTTRGFSKCNGLEVIGLAIASAAGGASLLGIAALIVGALIAFFLLGTLLLASTATSRRETDHARIGTPFPIALTGGAEPSRARRVKRPD
jgi:hypothetical protein